MPREIAHNLERLCLVQSDDLYAFQCRRDRREASFRVESKGLRDNAQGLGKTAQPPLTDSAGHKARGFSADCLAGQDCVLSIRTVGRIRRPPGCESVRPSADLT